MDYGKLTENLFFRVYEGTIQEEILLFDQLDMNSRVDSESGLPEMTIGVPIVSVDTNVRNDFQIRCYRNDLVEQQIGETVCLHTAFIEQNYVRVRITSYMQLDLFFAEQQYTPMAPQKDASFSSDEMSPETNHPRERNSPKDKVPVLTEEEKIMRELQIQSDTDNFWLTLSSRIIRSQQQDCPESTF